MWDKEKINAVWDKAEYVLEPNENKGIHKKQCTVSIKKSAYGNRDNAYGWEIDYITPESKEGTDALSNLRSLNWANNASRQDGILTPYVVSDGNHNVYKDIRKRL